jgi:hypothetical protein
VLSVSGSIVQYWGFGAEYPAQHPEFVSCAAQYFRIRATEYKERRRWRLFPLAIVVAPGDESETASRMIKCGGGALERDVGVEICATGEQRVPADKAVRLFESKRISNKCTRNGHGCPPEKNSHLLHLGRAG